jgi:hypothetical protein
LITWVLTPENIRGEYLSTYRIYLCTYSSSRLPYVLCTRRQTTMQCEFQYGATIIEKLYILYRCTLQVKLRSVKRSCQRNLRFKNGSNLGPVFCSESLLLILHAENARSGYCVRQISVNFYTCKMSSKYIIGIIGAVGTAFIGYCIYFDRKRRSDPNFKEKLRES